MFKRGKSRKRLPWKRGPVAWAVAQRADGILAELRAGEETGRPFLSLRASARLLRVSTQPLRDWIKRGFLKRQHPRRIDRAELVRFVTWLRDDAEPYDEDLSERFYAKCGGVVPGPFHKLNRARFAWPVGQPSLRLKELAERIGCHPSLIRKAIKEGDLRERDHQPGQWHRVTRKAWMLSFCGTLTNTAPLPGLPPGDKIGTREVAAHLDECGMSGVNQRKIRKLIATRKLDGGRFKPDGHKIYVTRDSLIKFRQKFKKTP